MIDPILLRETLEQQGLPYSDSLCEKLDQYAEILVDWNQRMNLTAITDPSGIVVKHFVDSLLLLKAAEIAEGASLIDVGTGAGFPGIPLAIVQQDADFTLLHSLGKRIRFLDEVREALGLGNVACVHGRAEEFAQAHREQFDLAVSRAVANLAVLSELCLPLVKVGGAFLAMKSTGCEAETEGAQTAIRRLGGTLERVVDYTIPTTDVTHRVLVIRKTAPTAKKYPRPFAQIKKQPL